VTKTQNHNLEITNCRTGLTICIHFTISSAVAHQQGKRIHNHTMGSPALNAKSKANILIASLCAPRKIYALFPHANRGKKSSAEAALVSWRFVGELATALTLSSPIDGQMSPRPLMASVIRSAQRHQHKSMLLCSINNKITRAARFLARRRRCAAHGKLRSLCTKKKAVRPSSPLSKPAPTARLICEACV
jgi:hypothetical protein